VLGLGRQRLHRYRVPRDVVNPDTILGEVGQLDDRAPGAGEVEHADVHPGVFHVVLRYRAVPGPAGRQMDLVKRLLGMGAVVRTAPTSPTR
jgi:hypothetical protein